MKKVALKIFLTSILFSLSIVVVNAQYIQDQFAIFQPATFRISGTGTLKNIITTAGQGEHFTLRTTSNSNRWNIYLSGVDAGNNTGSDLTFYRYNDGGVLINSALTIIRSTGNVGIGTDDPRAKLTVNGDVFARRIKVTQSDWPDFVFYENYQLPALQDIEKYILEHKCLPGIPSAAEVQKEGIDLGEINRTLLQKIEELTLHLIKMQKEIIQQQQELAALKSERI